MNEHAYETPPSGMVGWLYGYIDATVPGYRKWLGISATYSSYFQLNTKGFFPDILAAINAENGFVFDVDTDGRVKCTSHLFIDGRNCVWQDRLGWLLGFDCEPQFDSGLWSSLKAPLISPACIPLFSRTFEKIDRERERSLVIDRFGRPHGYVFGKADLWRWNVRMHRTGLAAFKTGWCQRGPVMLSPYTFAQHQVGPTAWSPSTPGGYLKCRVIGTEGDPTPIDKLKRMFNVRLIVMTGAGYVL